MSRLSRSWKSVARRVKDRILPGRNRRKEMIFNLGNHVTQLQEQVNNCGRSCIDNENSIQELENRVIDLQSQQLNQLAHQSAGQDSQIQSLSQQIEQVSLRAEDQHLAVVSERQKNHTELDCFLNSLKQVQTNLEEMAGRHFEVSKELTLVAESVYARIDAIDQQIVATNDRIVEAKSQLESGLQKTHEQALQAARKLQVVPPQKSRFCPGSYEYYSQLDPASGFVNLDVKSVPRSGLHYLQRSLQRVFGNHMSFCEWYQEPGCCKQMPCAMTGFAKSCSQQGSAHLRMIKSHDFDLTDPIFPANQVLRRIILIRDPIYTLTSYWNLQALKHNQELLQANGVNPTKIDYLHEQPVLQMAYSLIDAHGDVPSEAALVDFLEGTKKYMLGFIKKWERHVPHESVICYEQVDKYADQLIEGLLPAFPAEVTKRFLEWSEGKRVDRFQARENPFFSISDRLRQHLAQHAQLFARFATEIKQEDQTGLFASCGSETGDELTTEPSLTATSMMESTHVVHFRSPAGQAPAV